MQGKTTVSMLLAIAVSVSQIWAQETPAVKLGPNASEENRSTLSALLQDAAIKEFNERTFSASGKDEVRIRETIPIRKKIKLPFGESITIDETIEINKKLGDVEATATASFVGPAKHPKVKIPESKAEVCFGNAGCMRNLMPLSRDSACKGPPCQIHRQSTRIISALLFRGQASPELQRQRR
ncbi:hypothetical protein [Thalassoroseus pseudoceratinae]|uniref:hypothetical protein n=1 Tax=Thalassoroseus pseudoceratinae TaxID=2713176 RepID=UPI0014238A74|nr:hypothetical protein [Thalassoroseus pseudoceratinae]